jgi:hypothetical protein
VTENSSRQLDNKNETYGDRLNLNFSPAHFAIERDEESQKKGEMMGVQKRDGSGGEDGSLVFEVWIFHWRQVIPRTGAETQATANGAHQIQRSGLNPQFRISPDSIILPNLGIKRFSEFSKLG